VSKPQSDQDFEDEVRRLARAKWPAAKYSGAQMLDGRERDGVFDTEESINFVEATVSGGAGKAKEDTRKLFRAVAEYNRTGSLKVAVGWFVTRNEPTADQRREVQEIGKGQVRAVSFAQFQQSLIDVRAYLAARSNHGFGSVQDFASGSKSPSVSFVDIGLTDNASGETLLVNDMVAGALEGRHFAMVGQYGAGKSMTLREVFLRLRDKYIQGATAKFPIYINLREHSGQRDPVELLERHARSVGFESPSSLVRAWRAGFAILLADGFDEVTSLGVQGSWKKLRDLRMRSLEGIRRLIRDSIDMGVIVGGRIHYFEDDKELCSALGLNNAQTLSVDEFSDEQMKKFLSRFPDTSHDSSFPSWLPTRPLLLGYLASRGLLTSLAERSTAPDAVDGWDYLLGRIYEREERIETNLDGATLRRILERAATLARVSEDGLGPVTRSDLFAAFNEVCGYEPDEQGVLAIQRLPGLGIYRAEDESRCFVDKELAEVCNGRELLRFLETPYDAVKDKIWVDAMNTCDRSIGDVGAEFAVRRLTASGDIRGSLRQAAAFLDARSDLACVRGDVAAVVVNGNVELDLPLAVREMTFFGKNIEFHRELANIQQLRFSHCLFDRVLLEAEVDPARLPHFDHCLFEEISGRVSVIDLPRERFSDCEVLAFDSVGTAGAILSTQLTIGEKVLLVTLRKLFVQSLSGRAEGALFRGLDVDERRCVPDVLKLLKRHQLATEYSRGDGVVWLPARKALSRVRRILAAPVECGESVVFEARSLV
jgi:hypothetical protein